MYGGRAGRDRDPSLAPHRRSKDDQIQRERPKEDRQTTKMWTEFILLRNRRLRAGPGGSKNSDGGGLRVS